MSDALPLTILGGFLGAGKTTLVNHLLRHANGRRLAVLVNEFGELPIDEDLIEAESDDLISISGGCVCCSYGSDLTAALIDLARMDPPPDHVLLEASGVAIPGAIAATVGLLQGYRVDAIVVLGDAETLRASAADRYMGDTVTRQLNDADLLILNKCDLVSGPDLADLRRWLGQRDGAPGVIETRHGRVDPATVLDIAAGAHRSDTAPHHSPVQSRLFIPAAPVAHAQALAETLASAQLGLIRAKGFVTDSSGQRHLIQVVGRRSHCAPVSGSTRVADGIVCLGTADQTDWSVLSTLERAADQTPSSP